MSVLALGKIFDSHIYELSSLFLGLSLFAVPLIMWDEWETVKGKYQYLIYTFIGVAIVSVITYLNQNSVGSSMDIGNLNIGVCIYVFLVAAIAISAMVLPGISGSTLLLIFGLYMPIMTAIRGFLHFDFSYVPILVVFGLGILTGIFTSIKLIRKGLKKYRPQMIYLIIGLILGSLYAIVKGPMTLSVPQPAITFSTFHPLFFASAAIILIALQLLKRYLEQKQN